MSDFATLAAAIHATAQAKGWWEEWDADAPPAETERVLASIAYDHLALSGVLEDGGEDTRGGLRFYPWSEDGAPSKLRVLVKLEACLKGTYSMDLDLLYQASANAPPKPEGMVVELADVVIRIMDLCAKLNLDLEGAIEAKVAFNETRPYRHGGKKA